MYKKWVQRVEQTALDVLQKTGSLDSIPIDVNRVAKSLGLKIIPHDLAGDISGVLILNDGSGTIGVNPSHHPVRKRFTIAHEIGHFVLKHQREGALFIDQPKKHMVMYRDSKSSTGEHQQEREANAFAAALLMPKILLKKQIADIPFVFTDAPEFSKIQKLARDFDVSTDAMAFRLANLGYLTL